MRVFMQFSIVIPVYNEAGNLQPLLAEISRAVDGRGACEIIVVDDGSDDGTIAELRRARSEQASLRVLRHQQRYGQSSALLTGVRAARAPWIVTLDGDGQNDPRDIALLLERLNAAGASAGGLMLIGHRVQRRDTRLRRWSSRIANRVRDRLLGDGTPDTGCGLKLFPRDLFLSLPAFDHMHRFLPALMQRQGARVESVAVRHRPRRKGQSKYGIRNRLWVGLVDIAGVMWLQRRRLNQAVRAPHPLSRLADALGVYWLQRRPCAGSVEEEY
jgi:dolichol-phosphate mannosyltransferase